MEEVKISEEALKKYELITSQLEEVVGEEELKKILNERDLKIYWGTATTGKPHFGYFVPIFKISDYLKAGCHVTILFADLHAFLDNMKSSWELLNKRCEWYEKVIKEMLKLVGVPLEKLRFVKGTSFQTSKEYTLDMYKMSAISSTRDTKHAGAEVVKSSETPLMSSLLYPILQALDEVYLEVDAQFGGVDQRKIFMFAREKLPKIGYSKRCHLMNPLIPGLGKPASKGETVKMSASDTSGKIDFDDSEEEIRKKVKKAYSLDGEVHQNGLLAMLKYVLFRYLHSQAKPLHIPRAQKFGGPQTFSSYQETENAFKNKELASGDLKAAIADLLVQFLSPLRQFCKENQLLLSQAYPSSTLQAEEKKEEGKGEGKKGGKKGEEKKEGKKKGGEKKEVNIYEVDVRVGEVVQVEKHPKSERLYVEKIEVGEEKPRTIVSGLAEYYTLEELKGRKLLVMCNLKAADIGKLGVVSEGMVVAASLEVEGKKLVKLVDVPKESKAGERVKWGDLLPPPNLPLSLPPLKPDKLKKILSLLSSDSHGRALFQATHVCHTSSGECTSPLKNALLG